MIEDIRQKIARGQIEYSLHAVRQMVLRGITPDAVAEAFLAGEVIEDYPEDKYGPSCLVLGRTVAGRSLHIQCTYPSRPLTKIITAYEPDPVEWDATLKLRR